MFDRLVESRRHVAAPSRHTALALLAHVLVVAGLVRATPVPPAPGAPTTPLPDALLLPLAPPAPRRVTAGRPGATAGPADIVAPAATPPDLGALAHDPALALGLPAAAPSRIAPLAPGIGEPIAPADIVRSDAAVDPPIALAVVRPIYPPLLRDAGIAGSAELTFVVDSVGRVVPGSVQVIEVTRDEFGAAAAAAVIGARFEPARAGDRPVAVRVRQRYTFQPESAAQKR